MTDRLSVMCCRVQVKDPWLCQCVYDNVMAFLRDSVDYRTLCFKPVDTAIAVIHDIICLVVIESLRICYMYI